MSVLTSLGSLFPYTTWSKRFRTGFVFYEIEGRSVLHSVGFLPMSELWETSWLMLQPKLQLGSATFVAWGFLCLILEVLLNFIVETSGRIIGLIYQIILKLKSIRPSVLPWSLCRVDRRSSIVLTRLRIGHSYLTHKYLMASGEERRVPLSSTCRVELTIMHVLVQCPFYELKRRDNILSNMTLLEILGENAPVERIVKFLKDVNIFYDI